MVYIDPGGAVAFISCQSMKVLQPHTSDILFRQNDLIFFEFS
jgi:hypothetical protein